MCPVPVEKKRSQFLGQVMVLHILPVVEPSMERHSQIQVLMGCERCQ